MMIQRIMTALAVGLLAGYASVAFVLWSFNLMEWNTVQRLAVLVVAALIAGLMEGTRNENR